MKRMDIFCSSQAATAIHLSMDEGSSSYSSSSSIQLGSSRAIDRYNPIITDSRRIGRTLPSCSSQSPISPKPQNYQIKYQNLSSKTDVNEPKKKQKKKKKKTSTANPSDEKKRSSATATVAVDPNEKRKSWSCTKPGDFISPPGSSRYLLSDQAFLNVKTDFDPVLKLVPVEHSKSQILRKDETCASKASSSSPSPDQLQVVVLRVSLHCRGCERKMRKHISTMEGVSSFNIDFAAKKVTVVGNVTPLGVLASISKVKSAQLWNPATAPSSVSPVNQSTLEIKKLDVPLIS